MFKKLLLMSLLLAIVSLVYGQHYSADPDIGTNFHSISPSNIRKCSWNLWLYLYRGLCKVKNSFRFWNKTEI